ncbi:type I DNA topoisomerase [Candidatus Acetothermia bacterium]|nr:type I DNA topoisomerase [Candidatus Acetothermia bacterium]MBI3643468.1 type I DNA topoisomerase [Candidatus Acetothermia bacterium]
MRKLVIVESPTKARTIERYLGKGFKVLSSFGHVRDLPERELAVDIEKDFEPKIVVTNKKSITELKKAAQSAETVYLATDNDREGEAIAFDLYEVLNQKGKQKYLRVVFNEITKKVIQEAIDHPTEIDTKMVDAQRARRILDRLMGYLISPLLSKALSGSKYEGLSAGRVQSVALKIICDRELEIQAFIPQEYWEIFTQLMNGSEFAAELSRFKGKKPEVPSRDEAERIKNELEKISKSSGFVVEEVKEEESTRSPSPPFITSSLQQIASSMIKFSPKKTMQIAQQLYEGIELESGHEGLITYMRTDSLRISDEARKELREYVLESFGTKYLSTEDRIFKNKKAAQDAHEAIRPTAIKRSPDSIKQFLSADQNKLYKLIWERFTATQMTDALYAKRTVSIKAGDYLLVAKGSKQLFDGFAKVWKLPPLKDEGVEIPDLKAGAVLKLNEVKLDQKFTEPTKRLSEASLVKELEEKSIGRPSTYASIVSTIQDRGYVEKIKTTLRPTLLGFIVADFLKDFFPLTVEEGFTAMMEEELDKISSGEMTRTQVLNDFYQPFAKRLTQVESELQQKGGDLFQIMSDVKCPTCGSPMEIRFWKGNAFFGCPKYPDCKTTINFPDELVYKYHNKRVEADVQLKAHQGEREAMAQEAPKKICPKCGAPMNLREGKFGRFYGCSKYPDCKTTLPVTMGVPCPKCGRDLVERFAKKKRKPFWGCSGFPDCNFAVDDEPVKLCTECEEGVMVKKANEEGLICSNKNCGHREGVEEQTPVAAEAES